MADLTLMVTSLLLLSSHTSGLTDCSSEGVRCVDDGSNLIDEVSPVNSEEECRPICEDQEECDYVTYYPSSSNCQMFRTCAKTAACTSCVTQNMECYRTCGSSFVGYFGENVIDMISNTKSELDCKNICSDTKNCSFYTYYFEEDDLYPELCILLTDFQPPTQSSDSASSGPTNCSKSKCFFDVNGDHVESLMVTEDTVDLTANVTGLCTLRFLAVGGGGQGSYQGGGSGYLQYWKLNLLPGAMISINAKAGAAGEASIVTYNGIIIMAYPGHDGGNTDNDGGDGYSGGGQFSAGGQVGYNGGTDGSAGEGSLGGSGTSEDIQQYVFRAWSLAPGAGGDHGECGFGPQCGGGGGGVMVDGAGPGTDKYRGQGYGGGGSGIVNSGYYTGHKGLVLLEIF